MPPAAVGETAKSSVLIRQAGESSITNLFRKVDIDLQAASTSPVHIQDSGDGERAAGASSAPTPVLPSCVVHSQNLAAEQHRCNSQHRKATALSCRRGTTSTQSPAAAQCFAVGDSVTCEVDYAYRSLIAPNHTMTHVCSLALRTHYSADVVQKGSLCDTSKIRFDFAGRAGLDRSQIEHVQKMCQAQIAAALPVHCKEVPFEVAKTIKGLRYMAEAHYPENVRVVSIGPTVDELLADPSSDKGMEYSVELCGGTHMTNISKAVQVRYSSFLLFVQFFC